jgi:hypothetical protein
VAALWQTHPRALPTLRLRWRESSCTEVESVAGPLDVQQPICSFEQGMSAERLQDALERLTAAIRDVDTELADLKADHDPLASYIFVSRRHYRNADDTKSGKRREMNARLSFNTACELGFRGSLDEWERLMGAAVARR